MERAPGKEYGRSCWALAAAGMPAANSAHSKVADTSKIRRRQTKVVSSNSVEVLFAASGKDLQRRP